MANTADLLHTVTIIQGGWTISSGTDYGLCDGRFKFDASEFGGDCEGYFYVTLKTSSSLYTAYAILYDVTAGATVANTELTTTSTNPINLRKTVAFTLTDGHEYRVAIKRSGTATTTLKAAQIMIKQAVDPSNVQNMASYHCIAMTDSTTSTSYGTPTYEPRVRYDADAFDGTVATYFEATLKTSGSLVTDVAYAQLYDVTTAAAVANSEVSVDGTVGKALVRSSAITLVDGHDYLVQIKTTAGETCYLRNAHIVVTQTGAISRYQDHMSLQIGYGTTTSASYVYWYSGLLYPLLWNSYVTPVSYYEATVSVTVGGMGYSKIYDTTDSLTVGNSEFTTTQSSYTRTRSSNALTEAHLSNGDNLRQSYHSNTTSYTTTVISPRIVTNFYITLESTFTIDGIIKAVNTEVFTTDGVVKEIKTTSFIFDGIVVFRVSETFTTDGIVLVTQTQTFTVDAIVKVIVSNIFTIDGRVIGTKFKTFTADATIVGTMITTFTIDGDVEVLYYKLAGKHLPRPKYLTREFIFIKIDRRALNGKLGRDQGPRKEKFILGWELLTEREANIILDAVQSDVVSVFQVDDRNLQIGPVDVIPYIASKEYVELGSDYRLSLVVELIEEVAT